MIHSQFANIPYLYHILCSIILTHYHVFIDVILDRFFAFYYPHLIWEINNKIMSSSPFRNLPSATHTHTYTQPHTEVRNSSLNNSTSKMQYSFSKSNRFNSLTRLKTDAPYYDVDSDKKHQRSTTFGIGKKLTFEDRRELPASNTYTLEDDFCKEKTKKRGFSFGIGQKANLWMTKKGEVPGPGAYNPEEKVNSLSALMLGKVKDHTLDEKIKVPGPGNYDPTLLTRDGRAISSRHSNPRLPVILKEERCLIKKPLNPSPWAYNPLVTPKGGSLTSKRTTKFSDSKKLAIVKINDFPGPGCYNCFSEFAPKK